MTTPIPVVAFLGPSGSGKTTLMEKVIAALAGDGIRVAAVKHHSHAGFEIDRPGKDSWRFARAGSRQVVIAAPDRFATYRQLERELTLGEIAADITGVDIILVEGYRQAEVPHIEVMRAAQHREFVGNPAWRIAVVSDLPLDVDVPRLDLDDVRGVVDLIRQRCLRGGAPPPG